MTIFDKPNPAALAGVYRKLEQAIRQAINSDKPTGLDEFYNSLTEAERDALLAREFEYSRELRK